MSWKVPGYRAQSVENVDGDLESWRGIDEATGAEVILRRIHGCAGDRDEASWRSTAIHGIDHPGLAAPRQVLCDGDDLVVVYDVPSCSVRPGGRSRGPAYVAALICAVAGQLHALHAAGMTHGSVGSSTVRRGRGDPILIGAVESALREGSVDDTALDDVRSLAAFGMGLSGSAGELDTDDATRALSAILASASNAARTGDDPCDPSLSAELLRQCAPYAEDEQAATIPTRPGSAGGEYVARHRRAPARRRWARVRRVRTPVALVTPVTPVRSVTPVTPVTPVRPQIRRRVVPTRTGTISGPATGIAVVAVLVAIAAWMGTVWGDGTPPQGSAAIAAAQQSSHAKESAAPDATTTPTGFDAGSASAEQWVEYLGALYLDRATAITNRTAALLDRVYVPTSTQRDADLSVIAMLADSGARLVGFAPEILAVNDISSAGEAVVISVVDRIPPYVVVDVAGVATTHAGRGEQVVTLSLAFVNGKWLIDTAARAA